MWGGSIEQTSPGPRFLTESIDPIHQVTLPPRVRAALWHAYAWGRFRTRKYYWRGRNAALRCWRGWTAAVAGSEVPYGFGVLCKWTDGRMVDPQVAH